MVFSTLSLFRGLAANECKIRIAPNSSSDSISLQIMRALKSLGDFRSLSFEDADGYEVDGIQLVGALAQVSCSNAPAEAPAAAAAGTVECPFQYLSALVGRECWADGSCSTILKVTQLQVDLDLPLGRGQLEQHQQMQEQLPVAGVRVQS